MRGDGVDSRIGVWVVSGGEKAVSVLLGLLICSLIWVGFHCVLMCFPLGGRFVRGNPRGEHRGHDRSPDAPVTARGPLDGFPRDLRRDVSTSSPSEGGPSEDP